MPGRAFEVRKTDLGTTRLVDSAADPAALQPGQVLLRVTDFAFTANNITYGEIGERFGYWQFFPTAEPDAWGIIPVWGFAEVESSRAEGIAAGERLYGYMPMATHLVLQPAKLSPGGCSDSSPHRAKLPPAYNSYMRVSNDAAFAGEAGALQALLRPLFITSFLIDDFLAEAAFFGATSVVLSSASSKTAIGLAQRLHTRGGITVVGLTSAANAAFVAGLGCYDRTVTYDAIAAEPAQPAVFVDFAGSGSVRAAVHGHWGAALKYSCAVGLSHRETNPPGKSLPGVKPVFFFAPDRIVKRGTDWGRDGLQQRLNAAWDGFVPMARRWLQVTHGRGPAALERVYRDTLDGRVSPAAGNIVSLWD